MRVRKFEAKSMKDALQMVKNELGPDAVILSARDNRKSFGIAGEASVEITAAVSETTLQKKKFVESRMTSTDRARFQKSDARTQRNIIDRMVDTRAQAAETEQAKSEARLRPITRISYIDIHDEEAEGSTRRNPSADRAVAGRRVRELLQDEDRVPQRQPVQRPAQPSQAEPLLADGTVHPSSTKALSRIRNAAREAWQAGLFSNEDELRASSPSPNTPNAASELEVASLKGEIDRLQKMIEGFQKVPQGFVGMHPGADYGIPYDVSWMFQKLTEAGVTIDNTVDILSTASKEIDPVQIKKRPVVDAWVARWFLSKIQVTPTPWQGRVQLFVGGAGSGKTSQLVKIASQLVVKEKKKIAILSTDSYKVGAVDQLKIYCQILNVPFAVIRNRKDWEWVLSQLRHVDHILVDFPGFQLRDLDEIHLLKSLLPPEEAAAVAHLCIAATTKDGDAYEIARRYKVAEFADLVITNLDQSVQHGIIYNIQQKTGKPLHSFGIGNRIPEDFEPASKERVLDLIFKLTKLRKETT